MNRFIVNDFKRAWRARQWKKKPPPWKMSTMRVRHKDVVVTIEDRGRGSKKPRFEIRFWRALDFFHGGKNLKPELFPLQLLDVPMACRLASQKLAKVCVQQSLDPVERAELQELRKTLMEFVRKYNEVRGCPRCLLVEGFGGG